MGSGAAVEGGVENASVRGSVEGAVQVVTFRLVERVLGFPLMSILEILPMVAITNVPESTVWLPGVINLRGRTLPVMDLRQRLGLPPRGLDPHAAIIVAEPQARDPVGFIVDRVPEIVTLPQESLSPVDPLSGDEHPVDALARYGERVIAILSVDRLVSGVPDLHLPEGVE